MEIERDQNLVAHFKNNKVNEIVKEFGSPLYLYDEDIIRKQCRKIKSLSTLPNFKVAYSAKANSNISIMKIIREEGIKVDAMSLGEIYLEELAGWSKEEILFLSNNVSRSDLAKVVEKGIRVCVDSLSQLRLYCEIHPKSEVYIRLNPGKGAGHHDKVITAGKVKFGIEWELIDEAIFIAAANEVTISGVTIHIGSLFLEPDLFHQSVQKLLDLTKKYPCVNYIDFGGGLGIPYNRKKEKKFPLEAYSSIFDHSLKEWMKETKREPTFAIEPGRFIVAEGGVCLTTVQSVKNNGGIIFVGTDLGFNFLVRPEMYGSYHEVVHGTPDNLDELEVVNVVGNVCESGDTIGKNRNLPKIKEGDVLIVRDTGAYGFSMASNYNSMQRPAEVLINHEGSLRLIREREKIEQLDINQVY